MQIKFFVPRWGSEDVSWPHFTAKAVTHGYDGVEVYPLQTQHERADLLRSVEDSGLELALIHSEMKEGQNFERYKDALHRNLYTLAEYQTNGLKPRFINSHTGREYYTVEQMLQCFEICRNFSAETGIPVIHETHRNKWAYAAHVTAQYLKEQPAIRLALDLSHWVCVSESYLEDQDEAVELAIRHAVHVHARVGHLEGPQVTDPRAPENAETLQYHLAWWDRWINHQLANGATECTITPEFGPHPYMCYYVNTCKPVANQWEINLYMKNMLKQRYAQRISNE